MTVFKNFGNNYFEKHGPVGIDMFKGKNRNTRTTCEICSELKLVSAVSHFFTK